MLDTDAMVPGNTNFGIDLEENLVKRGKENTVFPLPDPIVEILFLIQSGLVTLFKAIRPAGKLYQLTRKGEAIREKLE